MPPLSQEQREKYVKLAAQIVEESKGVIRGYRDDIRKKIRAAFDKKEITEDDKFRFEKQVDEETKKINEVAETHRTNKEKEVMTV